MGEVADGCAVDCDDSGRDVETESKAEEESVRVYERRRLTEEFTNTDLIYLFFVFCGGRCFYKTL